MTREFTVQPASYLVSGVYFAKNRPNFFRLFRKFFANFASNFVKFRDVP
jgi:hypothetical protein